MTLVPMFNTDTNPEDRVYHDEAECPWPDPRKLSHLTLTPSGGPRLCECGLGFIQL